MVGWIFDLNYDNVQRYSIIWDGEMREATLLIQLFGLTQLYNDESGQGVQERKYPKPTSPIR